MNEEKDLDKILNSDEINSKTNNDTYFVTDSDDFLNEIYSYEKKDQVFSLDEIENKTENETKDFTQSNHIHFKEKKKSGAGKAIAVAGMVLVFGAATMGVGIGVGTLIGNNSGKNIQIVSNTESSPQVVPVNLTNANNNISAVVEEVSDSVVSINTVAKSQNMFGQIVEGDGAGSGVIFKEDDEHIYILTNNHVINNATAVTISVDDKDKVEANFVGRNSSADLAVVSVLKSKLAEAGITNFKLAAIGNSETLQVGESVLAIGNALGEGKSVTLGIVSAKNKTITVEGKNYTMLQTDAAINPGNSGGALVNSKGELVGINSAKLSASEVEGMGYSIPINSAIEIANDLMANGTANSPYLGVSCVTIDDNSKDMYGFKTKGVYIADIVKGGTGSAAGLSQGDIIVGINDKKVLTVEELQNAIKSTKVGEEVKIYVYKGGTVPAVLSGKMQGLDNDLEF